MRNLSETAREDAFREFYEAVYPDVLRYAQRRTGREHAEDVAAQTLLVVWRRFDDVPHHPDPARAWVFGIARNVLLNDRRGEQRRDALGVRLADLAEAPPGDVAESAVNRLALAAAWRALSDAHQETLALAVFEDLTAPQAAAVLGISPVAFRLRLTRARRALRLHLDDTPLPASPLAPATIERTTTP